MYKRTHPPSAAKNVSSGGSSRAWKLPTLMLVALSLLFCFEWRSSRNHEEEVSWRVARRLRDFETESQVQSQELEALLRSLHKSLGTVSEAIRSGHGSDKDSRSGGDAVEKEPTPIEDSDELAAGEEEDLPPLPEGVQPERMVENLDLEEFFQNPAYNSSGEVPTREEMQWALSELTIARARREILESQMRVDITQAMGEMREQGDYVAYAADERPQSVRGVLTAGEPAVNGGTRIYYLHPEQFPSIYEKKTEKKEIAKLAIRRLLSLVN